MTRLERWQLFSVELPYRREKHWASAVDASAQYAVLRLEAADGSIGVSEATVKMAWNSMSMRCLEASLEDVVLSPLHGVDLADTTEVSRLLGRIRQHGLATSLVDMAVWDLRANSQDVPLWQFLGGDRCVTVSWTVTRQPVEAMVDEAAAMTSRHGFGTLKIKGGQGISTDIEVVSAIRKAVGDDVVLFVDANGAYLPSDAVDYVSRLADVGVVCVEDPCPLQPDAEFDAIVERCPVPVVVDRSSSDGRLARLYVERNAPLVSVRLPEVGTTNALEIIRLAKTSRSEVSVGMYTEATIGACAALSVASVAAREPSVIPAESSFFLELEEDYSSWHLDVQEGVVILPDCPAADLVDWSKLSELDSNS